MNCQIKVQKVLALGLLVGALGSTAAHPAPAQSSNEPLEREFLSPPDSAKPLVWWHWCFAHLDDTVFIYAMNLKHLLRDVQPAAGKLHRDSPCSVIERSTIFNLAQPMPLEQGGVHVINLPARRPVDNRPLSREPRLMRTATVRDSFVLALVMSKTLRRDIN